MSDSSKVHDRELLDTLETISGELFSGEVWRTTWMQRDPLLGSSGGGRWDPPGSCEVLYTSTDPNGSLAEIYYHLSQAPVFSSSEMLLHHLSIEVEQVLPLTESLLKRLGLEEPLAGRINFTQSQAISGAARFLGFKGLLTPSVRWDCMNVILFLDQIARLK